MLNKEICKQCLKKYHYDKIALNSIVFADGHWTELDDKIWSYGLVVCPCFSENNKHRINDDPPEECSYRLEHLLNERKKE